MWVVRVCLPILVLGISGCSFSVPGSNKGQPRELAKAASPPVDSATRFLAEKLGGRMLTDRAYQQELVKSCQSARQERLLDGKRWIKYRDCAVPFRVASASVREFSLLLDERGAVVGMSYLSLDPEILSFLDVNYPREIVHEVGQFCLRYGRNTLPLLVMVRVSLCESLHYGL